MAVPKTKIAAVSYLNTVPFVYGITHADELRAELVLCPPAECARQFLDKKVDVALVPVGSLRMLDDAEVVTDFCIGANGSVRTVVVMSDSPISELRRIWLDDHSMTSALLVRILAAELWKINPEWKQMDDYSVAENPAPGDAFLFIGDKVFGYEGKFKHTYDLAECWEELTGKPFVFAVWVARKGAVPDEVIDALELSLTLGVERIWEAVSDYDYADKEGAYMYLTQNIDFLFDQQKHKALELFWDKGLKAVSRANPG